ncbi:MAG: hypothetical protein F6K28_32935 [Microcoleus sp. SIO2G3]|nr:hypothetical protein [Microcoleus sp. SIO2G3]
MIVLRIGAALLGGGLVTGSGTPIASPQPSTVTGTPQSPANPETQPPSSAAPVVKGSFICESSSGDTCTSNSGNLTRNSAIAFTVEFENALDASTQYHAEVQYLLD